MNKAKAAVSEFLGKSGQHDTSVHEHVAPAVQHETVKSHQHENVITAVDKEVHQEHHHRTVQPIHDREVLAEKHTHNIGDVEHRQFDHRDNDTTKERLAHEQGQFKDLRRVENMTTSQDVAPVVGGEHIHHHVHETIQPVIQKETIQPNVVHTTKHIHEVHHNQAKHHNTSTLPAMTMDEFKSAGGGLQGRGETRDHFDSEPRGSELASKTGAHVGHGHHDHHHQHGGQGLTGSNQVGGQGLTGSNQVDGQGLTGSNQVGGQGLTGSNQQGGQGLTGSHHHQHGGQGLTGSNTTGTTTGNTTGTI